MHYLHTMVRARNLDETLDFLLQQAGPGGRSVATTARRAASPWYSWPRPGMPKAPEAGNSPCVEITWNWDPEDYDGGRNFGHLAYQVEDIYAVCQRLMEGGVTINRPPRDGHMAFIRSPDGISIELLQAGESLPPREPWASMENIGSW